MKTSKQELDTMAVPSWQGAPPRLYSIVTGFFPEALPKDTWATNPRPLLVCGVAQDPDSKIYFCRIAYGTSRNISKAHANDLVIGNMSLLDSLCLKKATRFLTSSGNQMVIMPWTDEFFQPWTGKATPILSMLPEDMQRFVGGVLATLDDLPQF